MPKKDEADPNLDYSNNPNNWAWTESENGVRYSHIPVPSKDPQNTKDKKGR